MDVTSRGRAELSMSRNWKSTETSPERTKVWSEPKSKAERKVPVVYYLSRNGQLEHPHFMEVPLSSSEGLYLRDVISRLDFLRGKGLANLFSWSCKRSYRNGFVWHDISKNDFIYPAHGQEYVLKGSELLEASPGFSFRSNELPASISSERQPKTSRSIENFDSPIDRQSRNQSCSSIDFNEYKFYKTETIGESSGRGANVSVQADDKSRRRRSIGVEDEEEDETPLMEEKCRNHTTVLSREDISPPPPSNSSTETLETLIKADRRVIIYTEANDESNPRALTANNHPSGRMKASAALKQLVSCGLFSTKDSGPVSFKDQGLSLISQCGARLPRVASNHETKESKSLTENASLAGIRIEDKEYFSGSVI